MPGRRSRERVLQHMELVVEEATVTIARKWTPSSTAQLAEIRTNYPAEWAAMKAGAAKLDIGAAETVRTWVRTAEVDAGQQPGVTSDEAAEIKRLKAENAGLRRANEILKAASTFFAAARFLGPPDVSEVLGSGWMYEPW